MKKFLWASVMVFIILITTVAPAFAAGPLDGRIILGGSFTLESGQILDGDLVVFAGSVDLEADSRVTGDVAVLGGSADVAGTVNGDLVVFGGSVELMSTAVVGGELVTFGGNIDRAEGAIVQGSQVEGFAFGQDFDFPNITTIRTNGPRFHWGNWLLRFFYRIFKALMFVVLITVIGILVAVLLPQPLERVSQAVLVAPAHSWVVGFLAAVLGVIVGGTLIVTLCLAPFGAVVWLALLIACIFGWTALGLIVGLRILEQLNSRNVTPVMGVAVGSVILSLITAVLWIITDCCLGWPFVILVGSFGLGAVVLTRFGTQEYVPAPESPAAPQPSVLLAEDEGEFVPAEPEPAAEIEETPPDPTAEGKETLPSTGDKESES